MAEPSPAASKGPPNRNKRMVLAIAGVLVLAILAALASAWYATTLDSRAYARAASLLEQGAFAEAESAYLTLGLTYPESSYIARARADLSRLNLAWALALAERGDYELSTYKLEKVLDSFPGTAEAQEAESAIVDVAIGWSEALRRQGDFARADQVLGAAARRNPASSALNSEMAEVALAWGQALAAANDYAAALDTLRAGLDAFPEAAASGDLDTAYLETAIAWGKALVAQGKFAEAQAVLQDASARVPGDTLNTEMRALDLAWAQALIDGAQLPQAIAKITDLTERWPDSPEVQELAARLPDLYLRRADDLALDLPASYTAALEAYQLVSEKYAGSPAAQQVGPRVFALYMSYGRSQISAAEQATRQPNQEETRAALKRAREAFQQALEITPGTEEAAGWVRRIGAVNPATAPVFVVAPGSQAEVVIRLPPNPPIKQQLDYRKSRVVVKATVYDHVVHAALKDAETTWSESGQLGPVVYQISIAVSGEVGGDTYRQLLDAGLYWPYYTRSYSTPSRTVGELIQHQGCVFFVIVP